MGNELFKEMNYYLIPGKLQLHNHAVELHNQVFDFWNQFWSQILLDVTGERRSLSADDFLRQDYVATLFYKNEIVGLHGYSMFNLKSEASLKHSYFKRYYPPEFITELKKRNLNTIMTMEYFSVTPAWQKNRLVASLAKIIALLGLRIARDQSIAGVITAARSDIPAATLARKIGAIPLTEPIEVHGKPTELLCFDMNVVEEPNDPKITSWLNDLWQRRIDMTAEPEYKEVKKIA